jgi:hypothetical protein
LSGQRPLRFDTVVLAESGVRRSVRLADEPDLTAVLCHPASSSPGEFLDPLWDVIASRPARDEPW